jgi:hypothetical protein
VGDWSGGEKRGGIKKEVGTFRRGARWLQQKLVFTRMKDGSPLRRGRAGWYDATKTQCQREPPGALPASLAEDMSGIVMRAVFFQQGAEFIFEAEFSVMHDLVANVLLDLIEV